MHGNTEHGERSDDLVAAATRVIVRHGVEAASPRGIAAEAGVPDEQLTHGFGDRDDTLLVALEHSHRGITARWASDLADVRGLAALRALLVDNLPLDDQRALETRLEVTAWYRSLLSPAVSRVQAEENDELKGLLRVLVGIAYDTGELATDEPLDDLVERLLALVDGLSLHLLLYPDRLSREQSARILTRELDLLDGS